QVTGRSTKPLRCSLEETCSAPLFASFSTTTLRHKPLAGALRLIAVVKPRRSGKQSKRQHIVGLGIRQLRQFVGEKSFSVVEPSAEAAFDLIRPLKTSRR